jgi:hypothetical protein
MVRKAERLHRVFEDFAAAVVGLREYIADGEKEEAAEPDRFYDAALGPLALETLCLWVDRVKGLPRGPKGERLAASRAVTVLDKVNARSPAPLRPRGRAFPAVQEGHAADLRGDGGRPVMTRSGRWRQTR